MMPPTRFTRIYSSPHTRRYFRSCRSRSHTSSLFSAHAEVFPCSPRALTCRRPLLRTRGGISGVENLAHLTHRSSPHTRRYFQQSQKDKPDSYLFSAHAEVFPGNPHFLPAPFALLRTRGGISVATDAPISKSPSSPHTRRYFQEVDRG